MGGVISAISGFFGGAGGSSVAGGLGICLLALLSVTQCQRADLEKLSGHLAVVTAAAEGNARAAGELRAELKRREAVLSKLEAEREQNQRHLAAVLAEARQSAPDWRALALPGSVRALPGRLLGNQADPAGGDSADCAAGIAVAGFDAACLVWRD